MHQLQSEFDVSERRACHVLDQPRSTQRYESSPRDDEATLAKRIRELVKERPRFGYRRIGRLLRCEGLAGEQHAGVSPVAAGRAGSATKEAEKATSGLE